MRGTAAASGDFLKCTDDINTLVKLGGITYTGSNKTKPTTTTWDESNQAKTADNTLSKCDEVWKLSVDVSQCMSIVGYAQREMYSASTKADFTWQYRKYDVFTGWVFEAKTE